MLMMFWWGHHEWSRNRRRPIDTAETAGPSFDAGAAASSVTE
jgi:hypothetical protein